MKSKKTKKALTGSVLALVLCFVMLLGTTFAWFTDTASTSVNKIQAGKLKIEFQMKDTDGKWVDAEGKKLNFVAKDGNTNILWEPGCYYETNEVRITNTGNLALKFILDVTDSVDSKLNDVIDWDVWKYNYDELGELDILAGWNNTEGKESFDIDDEFVLQPNESVYMSLAAWMDTDAGNEYQEETLDGIAVTVYATQWTEEYDSTTDQYDKDATYLAYPAGVTAESFTGNNVAAYVDSTGTVQYTTDLYNAISAGATTIYLKEGATTKARSVDTNRTQDLTHDLTIYANGADFQYGEISINMTNESKSEDLTLKVYDAKNIKVWGATPDDGVTQTIVLENCRNEGTTRTGNDGIMVMLTGTTGTINMTVNNCTVAKNNTGIYMGTNGSLTVTNSTFEECCCAIKTSFKATGTRNDEIKNCTFINNGCTTEEATSGFMSDDSSAIFYKNKTTGTLNLTLSGNTFVGTIGGSTNDVRTEGTVNITNS